MRRRRIASLVLAWALFASPVSADSPYRGHIDAAAARVGLEPALIADVIAAESGGDARAVSPAGAMGLMQLMPATWAELRARLSLGSDPFDPADNILAGAAYLRWLRDRYGAPGFLAAYNAGPGRYEESLAGRPLPLETRRYVDKLTAGGVLATSRADWRSAGLFASAWSVELGAPATRTAGHPSPSVFAPSRDAGR